MTWRLSNHVLEKYMGKKNQREEKEEQQNEGCSWGIKLATAATGFSFLQPCQQSNIRKCQHLLKTICEEIFVFLIFNQQVFAMFLCFENKKEAKAYTHKNTPHTLYPILASVCLKQTRELLLGAANKPEPTALMSTKTQQSTERWRRLCPKSSSLFCKDTEPKNWEAFKISLQKESFRSAFIFQYPTTTDDKRFVWQ